MIIVGAGGFGRELVSWMQHGGAARDIAGYLDDAGPAEGMSAPYLGTVESYAPQAEDRFICAIGDPAQKRAAVTALKSKGAQFEGFRHPSSIIVASATLGEGTIVGPFCVISNQASIGDFVTLNSFCGGGHDIRIGDFSTLSAYIDVTGWVTLGEEVFIGSHASILPKVKVGNRCRIGAGAVVMRSMPDGTTSYAQPAKRLR
ncbi:MAG TPA: NeuD/PglB/VioB family sugar acetyltransferase [Allosphingosinicella sp.]|jgi:sugar O-acyltransferase (sialic acid O-acetyltransferase NeuD family)